MDNKHVKLSVIGFAILLIGLASVSYAFFNYTRTGEANTVRTGRIYFNATQGQALNITNAFPMTSTEAGNANLDTVTLGILGDTTYADGEEFEVTLVNVSNTINNKEVPMNYIATYTANTGGSIGASSDTYWTARNSKNANIYTLTSSGEVEEGKQVLVGYIKSGATGINGTLSISAYIDADRVAISDTYYGNATSTPLPTGPNDQYGTTTEWVNGRTVFTTAEWNSIASNPVSFKIKAESQEGIWVGEPIPTIASCPGCKFMYHLNSNNEYLYTTWNTSSTTPTEITTGLYDNYNDLVTSTGKNYFLGVKLNSSNQVTNAYTCGVKNNVPFCIEGTSGGTAGNANESILQSEELWNGTCSGTIGTGTVDCGSWNGTDFSARALANGFVYTGINYGAGDLCYVFSDGRFACHQSS